MAQQYNSQNIKKRYSVLVFLKGSTAPLVLYVENPEELYTELQQAAKATTPKFIEKETTGPLKKFRLFLTKLPLLLFKKNNMQVNHGI